MRLLQIIDVRSALSAMQWRRGLRAGIGVGVAMAACYALGRPMGWAALGALQVIMVDNGGPYRSRLANILTTLVGGSIAVFLGIVAGVPLPLALAVSISFCFALTLARVLSQPLAASSVIILVTYIVAFGGAVHTTDAGWTSTLYFVAGALWAAFLSLVLWPTDPFRPARNAVADLYATLTQMVAALRGVKTPRGEKQFNDLLPQCRMQIEAAHAALAATPARMTSRTVRARNLTALVESADLMVARLLRFAELGASPETVAWLQESLAPIEPALRQRPITGTNAFTGDGSLMIEMRRKEAALEAKASVNAIHSQLVSALCDTMLNFAVAYEAVRAVWTGAEVRSTPVIAQREEMRGQAWLDTLHANLTLRSVMFRHAIRLAIVVGIDVVLMYALRNTFNRYTHGYWLAMTSIIVLQPFTGETVKRSAERVAGTVAGGVLAAVVASGIHNQAMLIAVISVGATLAIALYTIDYAWYCFFLTPTIVLMTMPHLRDWRFAGVRMGMTVLGAAIAVAAMLLLWPDRESLQLPGLLARGAAAEAAYIRAVVVFWQTVAGRAPRQRVDAERTILAPARRLCGLAANDAEETLDHALIEHSIPLNPAAATTEKLNRGALTFTAYLRRLTQTITTLAADEDAAESSVMETLAARLDAVSQAVEARIPLTVSTAASDPHANEQVRRLERQVGVLERTVAELAEQHPQLDRRDDSANRQ